MRLGIVGLGRMGANMVKRLVQDGHEVVVANRSPGPVEEAAKEGAIPSSGLEDLIGKLNAPRVVWLMLPAGDITETHLGEALKLLAPGDIVVDGANSNWQDSMRRAKLAEAKGVRYIDAGVSGGIWGLKVGYCLMVGGPDEAIKVLEPAFTSLAPEGGYAHVGPSGSGHFVKMIHNGIEYGMMQAYGEGFEALASFKHHQLDLTQIAHLWQNGSVVRSWLLELAGDAFEKDGRLEGIKGYVEDSGEGRWTLEYSIDNAVPMPAIAAALFARFASRQEDSFAAKVAAALRNEFGGHSIKREP